MSEEPSIWKGPFLERDFPEFRNIQLILSQNNANWYYNDYWKSVDRDIYRRYYLFSAATGGHTLPESSPTPSPDGAGTFADPKRPGAETGGIPRTGANGILLELTGIHFSSLFGGSVQLIFEKVDDYYYEFRFDPFVYDLERLELHIFLVPLARYLNPVGVRRDSDGLILYSPAPDTGGVFHSFVKSIKGVYVLKYQNTELGKAPDPLTDSVALRGPITYENNQELFEEALKHLNSSLLDWNLTHTSAKTNDPPVSFAYGFLHQLYKDTIPTGIERPKRISIQDNNFDLSTETGEFSFNLSCKVSHLTFEQNVLLNVALQSYHEWLPAGGAGEHNREATFWDLDYPEERSTDWHNIFRYTFKDAEQLRSTVERLGTENLSMSNATANILVQVITLHRGIFEELFADFIIAAGDFDISVPMMDTSQEIVSVYDLAQQKIGGIVIDDVVTTRLVDNSYEEPDKGVADIRIVGHLRII